MGEFPDKNEGPFIPVFLNLSARSGAWRVRVAIVHVFLLLFTTENLSMVSKCCSKASMCFDQNRRNGSSHAVQLHAGGSGSQAGRGVMLGFDFAIAQTLQSDSTSKCPETDGWGIRSCCSISPTECSDASSKLRMARRFGSATMANDDSMGVYYPCRIYVSRHIYT